jgi:hypothetical protein
VSISRCAVRLGVDQTPRRTRRRKR